MSNIYTMVCEECLECIGIGQNESLWSGEPKVMDAFSGFLKRHFQHHLTYVNEYGQLGRQNRYDVLLDVDPFEPDDVFKCIHPRPSNRIKEWLVSHDYEHEASIDRDGTVTVCFQKEEEAVHFSIVFC